MADTRMTLTLALFLPLAFGFFTAAQAQSALPPPDVQNFGIESIDYRGTGCRPGTVASNVSGDSQAFSLIFSDYTIDTSLRSGRPMRKACLVNLRMRLPRNWSFAVLGVQLRGYAALKTGAVGVAKTITSFGPRDTNPTLEVGRQRIPGPFDDNFDLFTDLPLNQVEWSPCGPERTRKLRIKTAIVVRPQKGYADSDGDVDQPNSGGGFPVGTISVDSLDGGVAQKFTIVWKKCGA